jgi:hypothetical protein
MGFLDASSNAVTDMLDGLIGSVPHLNRLDGFPEVLRSFTISFSPLLSILQHPFELQHFCSSIVACL